MKPALRVVGSAASGDVLAQAPFFAGLSAARRARVAALGRVERHRQDSQIYVLGDPADDFYVLAEGMVRFTLGLGKRATSAGEIIRRGQVFGWAAIVENARTRIANAFCLTPCEVIAIDGKRLMALMDADHSIGYALAKRLAVLVTSELTSFAAG